MEPSDYTEAQCRADVRRQARVTLLGLSVFVAVLAFHKLPFIASAAISGVTIQEIVKFANACWVLRYVQRGAQYPIPPEKAPGLRDIIGSSVTLTLLLIAFGVLFRSYLFPAILHPAPSITWFSSCYLTLGLAVGLLWQGQYTRQYDRYYRYHRDHNRESTANLPICQAQTDLAPAKRWWTNTDTRDAIQSQRRR